MEHLSGFGGKESGSCRTYEDLIIYPVGGTIVVEKSNNEI